ncbi:putative transposase [Nitrosococcus oceani ATCC 19707]|uniref:Transposase n=1 Tax=Nitrosococcus oceani (strain ATCC 19707 / BCRC 17464 / JCM 30415 / NCIMB 11848 / C-107) TaxID=323261 RepID=Q3JEY5_NITOC|nr:IS630 transposase-related protein [Nitrosococcus oceani]ABA56611.1 putative transposase [Nitrosococcus oceani ATCC 19707]GEM20821.1 transposase [Nitrosococcus oceani]
MTYSSDFHYKVLSVRKKEGVTIAEAVSGFCVGVASVTRWLKGPEPKPSRNKPATKIDMDVMAGDMFGTIRMRINTSERSRFGVRVQGINYALHRLGVSYKKKLDAPKGMRRRTARLPDSHHMAQTE